LAMPMVNSLGASGYPALQNFLSHMLDKRNRSFLLSSKKMFFVLLAALAVEMLEEVFWRKGWNCGQMNDSCNIYATYSFYLIWQTLSHDQAEKNIIAFSVLWNLLPLWKINNVVQHFIGRAYIVALYIIDREKWNTEVEQNLLLAFWKQQTEEPQRRKLCTRRFFHTLS
jgi:hypothetical protein